MTEPKTKRVVAFVDGQNLFFSAKQAFGYNYPNYDSIALASLVCANQGWSLQQVRFYTGVHTEKRNAFWYGFWTQKLQIMGTKGVEVFSRSLRYSRQTVNLPDGSSREIFFGQEKGVDVRLALDTVRMARENAYDVALIFSQDQDLSEAAQDIREIAREQNRWIKIASAFPVGEGTQNARGINNTDWIEIPKEDYNLCIDPNDYRPKT